MSSLPVRLSRPVGILCLLLVGLVLTAVSKDVSPIAKILLGGRSAFRALTTCTDSLGNPLVVYGITQRNNNRTFLHAIDPKSRKLLGQVISAAAEPSLVQAQFLADAIGLVLTSNCRTGYTVGYSDGNVYAFSLPDPATIGTLPAAQVVAKQTAKIAACKSPAEDVPPGAEDLALWEAGQRLLVACGGTSKVAVIDLTSGKLAAEIAVGALPRAIAVYTNGATNRAYTANFEGGTISVIDLNSNTVAATRPVGSLPFNVVANPTNPASLLNAYYLSQGNNTVGSFTPDNGAPTGQVDVCDTPRGIVLDPQGQGVFVTCSGVGDGRSGISRIATNGTVSYSKTSQLLDRYATFVCASQNAKCDAAYELWTINIGFAGEIDIFDANQLR